MARVTHDLRDDEWDALTAAWGGCAYCAKTTESLQRDCVLPISRGGRYTLANVVPACQPCNASKCNTEVTTWLRRKRLDEVAFLERWRAILAAIGEGDEHRDAVGAANADGPPSGRDAADRIAPEATGPTL